MQVIMRYAIRYAILNASSEGIWQCLGSQISARFDLLPIFIVISEAL